MLISLSSCNSLEWIEALAHPTRQIETPHTQRAASACQPVLYQLSMNEYRLFYKDLLF